MIAVSLDLEYTRRLTERDGKGNIFGYVYGAVECIRCTELLQ